MNGVDWNVAEKKKGKAPFLPAWQQNTLKNVEAIREAAAKHPGCNFGSVFTKDNFGFEADAPPNGAPTVRERFEQTGGTFTAQLIVQSSSSGQFNRGHRYYKWVEGVENIAQSTEAHKVR